MKKIFLILITFLSLTYKAQNLNTQVTDHVQHFFGSNSVNPADASSYYMGIGYLSNFIGSANLRMITAPQRFIITNAQILQIVSGTLGTTETATLVVRVNNTTDYNIKTDIDASAVTRNYAVSGLNIVINAGDTYELKYITPTWVTNPTSVAINVMLSSIHY